MNYGQGGPPWGPGGPGEPQTPDWSALASDAERRRNRKRWFAIGGSVLAAAAIGTVVALAIVNQSDDGGSQATDGESSAEPGVPSGDDASETPGAGPTFDDVSLPPLPKPSEFIADADKDIAPFEPADFFGEGAMTVDGREYSQAATQAHQDCAGGATPELGSVLTEHSCEKLLRATYVADGVAVTVGVAQFATEADAEAAQQATVPSLEALTSGDAPAFCQTGGCRTTSNQIGRYAYFTIAGNSDGSPDSGDGTPAQQAARDGNDHAFAQIIQRGESQASASASALVEERQQGGQGDGEGDGDGEQDG